MSAAATSGRAQKPSLHAVAMAPRSGAQVRAREPAAVVRPVVLPGLTRQKPKATPRPAVAPRITRQKRKAQSPQQPALRKQARPVTSKSKKRPPAWNKGRKHSKTSKQHVFIPREQLPLFFAVALYFAGPSYCAVLWITLVTSRRIGETVLLKGSDVRLRGGEDHDSPHILFQRAEGDQGNGKLPAERVVARLSDEAVDGLTRMKEEGLNWQCLPALEPYRTTHPTVFQGKKGGGFTPMRQQTFKPDWANSDHIFPSESKKKGCRATMARQTVWGALDRVRQVMYELTNHERRWNPSVRCRGNRVTVHGATRHTSAALLLFNSDKSLESAKPSQHVIMELQNRSDPRVFLRHYFHAHEEEIQRGLQYGAAPSPFKKKTDNQGQERTVVLPVPVETNSENFAPIPQEQVANLASNNNSCTGASCSSGSAVNSTPGPAAKPPSLIAAKAKSAVAPKETASQYQHAYVSRNACRQARRKEKKTARAQTVPVSWYY